MDNVREIPLWEQLYRYWMAKHIGGQPPKRADIDPMIDLPHMASNLIVIEIRPEGAEYRLVGSQVVSHFGADQTGKRVGDSNVDPIQLSAWRDAVEATARERKPHMLVSFYPNAEKTKTIALLMPLAPDSDGAVKLLAATFFGGPFPDLSAYNCLSAGLVELAL